MEAAISHEISSPLHIYCEQFALRKTCRVDVCVSCPTAPHRETSVLFVCCTVQVILWRLESTLSALPPLSQIQRWLPGALTLHVSLGQLFSLSFNTVFSSQMEGLETLAFVPSSHSWCKPWLSQVGSLSKGLVTLNTWLPCCPSLVYLSML